MTSSTTRRIVVDNTNPAIAYYGIWTLDTRGVQDGIGNSGPAFQHTLHGSPGSSFASLSFYFEGSSVDVVGRLNPGNSVDGTEPTWECLVDGRTIESASVVRNQNNQLLCSVEGLQQGTIHSLILQTNSDRVWFDYIEYTPWVGNVFNILQLQTPGSFISMSNQDPNLRYDPLAWRRTSNSVVTSTVGATLNTTFLGTSLMWYGTIASGDSGTATGTYSIDGQPPVAFVMNRPASSASTELTNQVFFETPLLPYDEHTVTVTYTAGGEMPLSLDRLVVRDQVAVVSGSSSYGYGSGYATPTAWASSSAVAGWPASGSGFNNSNPMSGGAIAATVIGSVLGFALIVAAFLFIWRRRRQAKAQTPAQGSVTPRPGDEKAVGKADTASIFSLIRDKIKKEKEELDYAKPPAETEQLPAYKARNSGVQIEVEDRV